MGRSLSAREVGSILEVSPKTARDWARQGILPGELVDNGSGQKEWTFDEDILYSCTDMRVVKRLKPAELSKRKNTEHQIETLEKEIADLGASLAAAAESIRNEREKKEQALSEQAREHEARLQRHKEEELTLKDASSASVGAIHAAANMTLSKRGIEKFFDNAGIRVRYTALKDCTEWNVWYQIKGKKAWYEMECLECKAEDLSFAMRRYLIAKEAGAFWGCRNASRERLHARMILYQMRLSPLILVFLFLGPLMKQAGVLTPWTMWPFMGLGVVAVVVVGYYYKIRIELLDRKRTKVQKA